MSPLLGPDLVAETPHTPSPKRKRGPSDPAIPFAPRIDTSNPSTSTLPDHALSAPVESNSPRTQVASRLSDLQIEGADILILNFGAAKAPATKKAKLDDEDDEDDLLQESKDIALPVRSRYDSLVNNRDVLETLDFSRINPPRKEVPEEVPETPQTSQPSQSSSNPSQDTPTISDQHPPPPTAMAPPLPTYAAALARAPSPEIDTSLTWQDSEITGHLANDPNDDGYGINGIGFKPTPAMAYARAQRRKQQVQEWKSREAKEARARRIEARRGATVARDKRIPSGGSTSDGEGRRVVRFA